MREHSGLGPEMRRKKELVQKATTDVALTMHFYNYAML